MFVTEKNRQQERKANHTFQTLKPFKPPNTPASSPKTPLHTQKCPVLGARVDRGQGDIQVPAAEFDEACEILVAVCCHVQLELPRLL